MKWLYFCLSIRISLIFGIGNGLQTILSLSFLKSLIHLTLVSFLGIMKLGKPHSDLPIFTRTPSYTMLASSLLNCSFLWNATGYSFTKLVVSLVLIQCVCLLWYGNPVVHQKLYYVSWTLVGVIASLVNLCDSVVQKSLSLILPCRVCLWWVHHLHIFHHRKMHILQVLQGYSDLQDP